MIARILLGAWLATGTCAWADPSMIADAPAEAAGSSATRGILFEIRPPTGAPPSFLFGTIHSEDVRVVELPAPVREAFDVSPNVAFEVVPDASVGLLRMESGSRVWKP